MLKDYIGKSCPCCITTIKQGVNIAICSSCDIPHHLECWQYNSNKCTTYGCNGSLISIIFDPLSHMNNIQVDNLDKDNHDCPFCAEKIKKIAKKCKHCGEWLNVLDKEHPEKNNEIKENFIKKEIGQNELTTLSSGKLQQALILGEKINIENFFPDRKFILELNWENFANTKRLIEPFILSLNNEELLDSLENIVFFRNSSSEGGKITLIENNSKDLYKISFNLNNISLKITKIFVILAPFSVGTQFKTNFENFKAINLKFSNTNNTDVLLNYKLDNLVKESTVLAIKIYKHSEKWKIAALSTGYNYEVDQVIKQIYKLNNFSLI